MHPDTVGLGKAVIERAGIVGIDDARLRAPLIDGCYSAHIHFPLQGFDFTA
jgi:hypothetical protein